MATPKKEIDSESAEGAGEEKRPQGLFSKTRILMAAGLLAVLALGGGGAFYFLGGKAEPKAAAAPAAKPVAFFDLPDVLVNLANAGGERTQYLKVKVTLELSDAALAQQIQPVLPRVMDAFQVFLRELRSTDLEGSAATYRLKEELTRRVNAAIAPSRINAVLFKEIVVQ
jgi:flagellar FliL protein